MEPLVSVLMPTYNCAKYIMASIESIKRQTYHKWELIIVNDGSTDSTNNILEGLNDDRIQVVNNPNNLGISESRNIAIQNAKGKYFAWLDSDDIATSDRLEKQVSFLENHDDYCLCCGNMVVIDSEESIIENVVWQPTNLPISWTIFWDNPVAQSSVMIRRSIFTSNGLKYSSKHAPAEDYDIWCQLTLLGKMHRLDDIILKYRSLESSAFHMNMPRAMIMSMDSNEVLLRKVIGMYPNFHRYLTVFSWVLPDRLANCDFAAVSDWLDKIENKYRDRFYPNESELRAIEKHIYNMLLTKTCENWFLFRGARNKMAVLRRSYQLFFVLALRKTRNDALRIVHIVRTLTKALLPFSSS